MRPTVPQGCFKNNLESLKVAKSGEGCSDEGADEDSGEDGDKVDWLILNCSRFFLYDRQTG